MNYAAIKKVVRICSHMMAAYSRELDFSPHTFTETYILITIGLHPGIIAGEISGQFNLDKGYLSRVLKKLEEEGLICRQASSRTAGAKELYVTVEGRKRLRELETRADRGIEMHVQELSVKERKEFSDQMEKTARTLEKIYPDEFYHRC